MFFTLDNLNLRYEPFPIGLAKPLMEEATYKELLANYPHRELFRSYDYLGKAGNKYTLSDRENRSEYDAFLRSSPIWKEFHTWIKSDAFTYGVLDTLKEHDVDLGYKYFSTPRRVMKRIKGLTRGRPCLHLPRLEARFEFSMLPSDGGHVVPHTDATRKVVTLVASMVDEGEWNREFGGGTDLNRPRDVHLSFNHTNRLADFDDMEILDTYEFTPNQAVVFVKTFNSWHSVRPMTGTGTSIMRKTLTINIEIKE